MANDLTQFDPSDATETNFLAALGLGETGGMSNAYELGVGSTASSPIDLSSATTDQYGFPQWSGTGGSHAAGEYQFQPATWDTLAAQYGLNFQNPQDQNTAAWDLAQSTYAQNTGGQSLETALQNGDYSSIETALAGIWPSITGSTFNNAITGGNATSQNTSFDLGGAISGAIGGAVAAVGKVTGVTGALQQWGIFIVGAIILFIALWQLLSQSGFVPSPAQTAKIAVKAAAA